MAGIAFLLVITSAFLHATWNLFYKRALDKKAFALLFGLAAVVLYLPAFVLLLGHHPIPREGWCPIVLSAAIHTLYFAFLGRGYSTGDLSLVYPLARGTGPFLVTIWAITFLGERLSLAGLVGIISVVAGIYVLHVEALSWQGISKPLRSLKSRPTQFALLTGFIISLYTVVDKIGVSYVQPIVYMYLWTALFTLLYGVYVLNTSGWVSVKAEWKANSLSIVAVGFLMMSAYILVLYTMTMSNVSYVAAAREVSVVFGAAMGSVLLREPYGRAKVSGSLLIAFGLAAIGFINR